MNQYSMAGEKANKIEGVFREFIKENFEQIGEYSVGDISYDTNTNSVFINARNKVLANELSLKLQELESFFRQAEILVKQIIIK